jgi:hypothetical protein
MNDEEIEVDEVFRMLEKYIGEDNKLILGVADCQKIYEKRIPELYHMVSEFDIILTGSRCYGEPSKGSDFDILIDGCKYPDLNLQSFLDIGWEQYKPHYKRKRSLNESDYFLDTNGGRINFKSQNHKFVVDGIIINVIIKNHKIFDIWVRARDYVLTLPKGMKHVAYRDLHSHLVDKWKKDLFKLLEL